MHRAPCEVLEPQAWGRQVSALEELTCSWVQAGQVPAGQGTLKAERMTEVLDLLSQSGQLPKVGGA